MLNVEQITNRLAQMPDPMLQKYAAMNKNDPYIMALAVSESNRRKQMRQAAQGAQGQIPQPKVVDQDIAQMAAPMPEEQGIARLPAGEMNFADGGIVAFAGGGDVEQYADLGFTGYSFGDWAAADRERRRKKLEAERAANMAQVAKSNTYDPADYGVTTPAPLYQDPRILGTPPDIPVMPADTSGQSAPSSAGAAPAVSPASAQSRIPPTPSVQAPSFAGLDVAGATRRALKEAGEAPNPFAKDVEALGKERVAAKEAEAEGLKAISEKFSDVYKGREKRLAEREGELAGMKDQNLGLALLQAGAAMMSTPGSLGMAIGKGIDTGSKQYVSGIERLNAAKDKLADARDRLEELQAQRGEMSARELLKAQSEIKNAGISAREDLIKSNQQMYGVNRDTALKMVDNQVKVGIAQLEQGGANARANAQIAATLNTPERQMWDAALKKHGGDTAAAFRELQSTKAEKFNPYQSYADYLKAFAGKENVLTPPMGFADYVAQFGTTTSAPPKGATVRTLPGG